MSNSRHSLRFLLNGSPVQIDAVEPTRSVLDYLRVTQRLTGTKEGCAEGDCGACTVVLGEAVNDELQLRAVNACIQFLPMLDGKAVFTVEYLRQLNAGELHPVQDALVAHHGSQCGFCTPGFVMSLWNHYEDHQQAGTRTDRTQLATCVSGNLCRCTGYRPIIDAGISMFDAPASRLNRAEILHNLRALECDTPLHMSAGNSQFHAPRKLSQVLQLRAENPQATVLAGCTDIGLWVNKQFRELGDILYLGACEELKRIEQTASGVQIGAAASLSDAYAVLTEQHPELDEMWERFASVPVRNAGTLGGNVANGSPIGDSMPGLIVLGAQVVLASTDSARTIPLEALYIDYMKKSMHENELVVRIDVPAPSHSQVFRTYKLSKRYDSDISAVCAAFSLEIDDGHISDARVAYGGMAATPKRADACEKALHGQPWNEATVQSAMAALGEDFAPLDDMRASAAYRQRTATALLNRFYLETRHSEPLPAALTSVFATSRASS